MSATDVKMRAYSDAEIEAYVETGDPLDKAGAYGIQDPQFAPVEAWDGCYSAVMGLPMGLAAEMLGRGRRTAFGRGRPGVRAMTGDRCCQRNGGLAKERREHCISRELSGVPDKDPYGR